MSSFFYVLIFIALLSSASVLFAQSGRPGGSYWVYIGTFTNGKGQGIYRSRLDLASGTLSTPELAADVVEPTYLALHPKLSVLYAATGSSAPADHYDAAAAAYAIDPATGGLTLMSSVKTGGRHAVYVSIDPSAQTALLAEYISATVCAVKIAPDGNLVKVTSSLPQTGSSIHPKRQQHAYPHSFTYDPAGRYGFSPDLGADKVFVYRVNAATGSLEPNDPAFVTVAPGSGPRHMVFDAAAKHAYLANELSNTIIAFKYDSAAGKLTPVQTTSTLPDDFKGQNTAADIRLHPSGKFLYASNRGHESIAIYAVNFQDGTLSLIGFSPVQVGMPRGFALDPTGAYLIAAGQQSDSLSLFAISQASGLLTFKGHIQAPKPVCVTFFHTQP